MVKVKLCAAAAAWLAASAAFAGTTTIDFTQGIGNLVRQGDSGTLTTDENCMAEIALYPRSSWAIMEIR